MKIATWNINSVRARVGRLTSWLQAHQPDALCLQELKCTDEQFPRAEVEAVGYRCETFGQKTYNGVAILSKEPLSDVARAMADGVADDHARVIEATLRGVRIVGVYAPNGQEVDSPAYQYKLQWYERLEQHLAGLPPRPTVLCGDFNVAPEPIDVHDPAAWEGQTLFTDRERAALAKLTTRLGLFDVYRKHHPEAGKFSWWDYRMLGFPKNLGLRIDHLWVSRPLYDASTAAEIDREARKGEKPSDHAPVWCVFDPPAP